MSEILCRYRHGEMRYKKDWVGEHFVRERWKFCEKMKCSGIFKDYSKTKLCPLFEEERRIIKEDD